MSTAMLSSPRSGSAAGARPVTFPRVLHSEWIKFRSLRSSYLTLLAAAGATVGFGLLFCWVTVSRWDHMARAEKAGFSPAEHSLRGFFLAQLAVGVLGVLTITGEYSTGMIRATLAAVPRRTPVLWAKAAVFAAVTWLVTTVACLLAFLLGQWVLAGKHLGTGLSAPGVTRVVLGTALYLTAIGLLAVGLGALIRNTAGGIASVFGLLLVLPVLAEVLPDSWRNHILPYLPSTAGQAVTTLHPEPHTLAPWTGFGLLCLYAAVALAAGAVLLRRRDA